MFVTVERTKRLTGYDVSQEQLSIAQGLIETYIGRDQSRVTDADDLERCAKAVAYQTAFMAADDNKVFELVAASSITQDSASSSFADLNAQYYSRFAVLALQGLSWNKSRSIKFGRAGRTRLVHDWKRD